MPQEEPYKFIAYIDEAGDEGLNRIKPIDHNGSSEWLILSAVVIAASREIEINKSIQDIISNLKNHQKNDIHFVNLNSTKKKFVCEKLSKLPIRCFAVASNKKNMRRYKNENAEKKILSRNWLYCWLSRILLERVTHFVREKSLSDTGKVEKVKIIFSEKGGHSYSQMNAYYQYLRTKSYAGNHFLKRGDISWDTMDRKLITSMPHQTNPGLQIADVIASSFFKACDIYSTKELNADFAKILMPRMATHNNRQNGIISGYGLKLLPDLNRANLNASQEEIFRFYGYPNEWWDPDPSNPQALRLPISQRKPPNRTSLE